MGKKLVTEEEKKRPNPKDNFELFWKDVYGAKEQLYRQAAWHQKERPRYESISQRKWHTMMMM